MDGSRVGARHPDGLRQLGDLLGMLRRWNDANGRDDMSPRFDIIVAIVGDGEAGAIIATSARGWDLGSSRDGTDECGHAVRVEDASRAVADYGGVDVMPARDRADGAVAAMSPRLPIPPPSSREGDDGDTDCDDDGGGRSESQDGPSPDRDVSLALSLSLAVETVNLTTRSTKKEWRRAAAVVVAVAIASPCVAFVYQRSVCRRRRRREKREMTRTTPTTTAEDQSGMLRAMSTGRR